MEDDGYRGYHHPRDISERRCPVHDVRLREGCSAGLFDDNHVPDGSLYCPVDGCDHYEDEDEPAAR